MHVGSHPGPFRLTHFVKLATRFGLDPRVDIDDPIRHWRRRRAETAVGRVLLVNTCG